MPNYRQTSSFDGVTGLLGASSGTSPGEAGYGFPYALLEGIGHPYGVNRGTELVVGNASRFLKILVLRGA